MPFWVMVGLAVGVGAVLRVQGLTRTDLWFDDAWAAISQRTSFSQAIHLTQTTPGWSLAERQWNLLDPGSSTWAQIPQLVCGIAAIAAFAALLRWWGTPRWAQVLGTIVLAVSPAAVTYSTRVKEYMADLLLSMLLLTLAERWRRSDGSTTTRWQLALGVAFIPFVSATLLSITAAVAAACVGETLFRRRFRWSSLLVPASAVGGLAVLDVVWLRHLTGSLKSELLGDGYLVNYTSLHRFVHSAQVIGAGLAQHLFGLPYNINRADHAIHPVLLVWSLVVEVALVMLVARPLVRSWRSRTLDPLAVAALTVAVAMVTAVLDVEPLGHGRTDLYLYPCLVLLLIDAVRAVRWRGHATVLGRVGFTAALAGMACVALLQPLGYPARDLKTPVRALLATHLPATTAIVLSPWNAYTWALDELTPTRIVTKAPLFQWSAGFHIQSEQRNVIISTNYFLPDWTFPLLHRSFDRIWYVGTTVGANDPHVLHPNALLVDRELRYLLRSGWRETGVVRRATGIVLVELVPTSNP